MMTNFTAPLRFYASLLPLERITAGRRMQAATVEEGEK